MENTSEDFDKKTSNPSQDFENYKILNRRIDRIRRITGYQFPTANVAFIYPIETIMAGEPVNSRKRIRAIHRLIARCMMAGIQLDVLSSGLLRESRLSQRGISIRNRQYDSIIFPYPEVLHPDVLEKMTTMIKYGIQLLFGGCRPQFTTMGKPISQDFNITFDPRSADVKTLYDQGIHPLLVAPDTSLTTMIPKNDDILFLICPKEYGESVNGNIHFGDIVIPVSKIDKLTIYRWDGNNKSISREL